MGKNKLYTVAFAIVEISPNNGSSQIKAVIKVVSANNPEVALKGAIVFLQQENPEYTILSQAVRLICPS